MRRLTLRMTLYDDEGNKHADKAIQLDAYTATIGERGKFEDIQSPHVLKGHTFVEAVEIMKVREFRRSYLLREAKNLGGAIADHLEDKEGWHGLERQKEMGETDEC